MEGVILLKVIGTQYDSDGNKNVENEEYKGRYFNKNNYHYVVVEDADKKLIMRYKFNHRNLNVVKNGETRANLMFELGQTNICEYATPYGLFPLEFKTKKISLSENEREIHLLVEYEIFNQGELVSFNETKISLSCC